MNFCIFTCYSQKRKTKLNIEMKIQDYINRWMFCKTLYYEDSHLKVDELFLVHDADREFVINNRTQALFKCISVVDNSFLLIKAKGFNIRVKAEAVRRLLPDSKFDYDELVREMSRPEITGKIDLIIWHEKDSEYKYYISINGKSKSRRYSANELERA